MLLAHHRHDGAGALASKLPVHISQFAADWWHQPLLSSPQSPQSAPNLQQPPEAGGAGPGDGGVGGVGTGAGASPLHAGAGALASKVPVQISQFAADWWHQPVLSSPQSPQSSPNLQQPPEAGGAGPGEGGAGPSLEVILQFEM